MNTAAEASGITSKSIARHFGLMTTPRYGSADNEAPTGSEAINLEIVLSVRSQSLIEESEEDEDSIKTDQAG